MQWRGAEATEEQVWAEGRKAIQQQRGGEEGLNFFFKKCGETIGELTREESHWIRKQGHETRKPSTQEQGADPKVRYLYKISSADAGRHLIVGGAQ